MDDLTHENLIPAADPFAIAKPISKILEVYEKTEVQAPSDLPNLDPYTLHGESHAQAAAIQFAAGLFNH
jgi:hypothetical protein